MPDKTWEEAVSWLRQQSDQQELVHACYYDDPLHEAAQRFAYSTEWIALRRWLPAPPGTALDLGAGRGISSYALARDGWRVKALEPNPSELVGAGAIRALAAETGLLIETVEDYGEKLPFKDASFDLVYGRQVLHHAHDLNSFCCEAARVLKPGGLFIATREHVISQRADLPIFLDNHPLHKLYGGENAFLLDDYLSALRKAGLRIESVLGSYDSPINYFPLTERQVRARCALLIGRRIGYWLAFMLTSPRHPLGPRLVTFVARRLSDADQTPGRLVSFVARK